MSEHTSTTERVESTHRTETQSVQATETASQSTGDTASGQATETAPQSTGDTASGPTTEPHAATTSTSTTAGESAEKLREEWTNYEFNGQTHISVENLDVHYGDDHALTDISIDIPSESVTALIGPSGCGKSTFLRCLNRMNDRIRAATVDGSVEVDGVEIYQDGVDLVELRKRVGMVFQQPNPFPKSIRDNVSYGPRKHGDIRTGFIDRLLGRDDTDAEQELVETALKRAALYEEVEDRLDDNALGLSGGQQQRLCIARALATDPEILLMDEPASALDPIATSRIEDLIADLSKEYTVVIVTHNMQQAARISDQTAVFLTGGQLVEYDRTEKIFENPESQRVDDYISGRFG